MKKNAIIGSDLFAWRPVQKSHHTDFYYLKLANQLFDDFYHADLDLGENSLQIMRYAAITLTNYMEDIVADSGIWRSFSGLCEQMFGCPVPLYHNDEEDYYPDEPSMMAVRFLLWHSATEMTDIWWNADSSSLHQMSLIAYSFLDSVFEDAPVNSQLADDMKEYMQKAEENFDKLRLTLSWIFSSCYLTRSENGEKLIQKKLNETDKISDKFPEDPMKLYYAINHSIFAYKIGPLALYPKDYLASMMRTFKMKKGADQVDKIEVIKMKYYLFELSADGRSITLKDVNDQELQIARDEITVSDKQLKKFDGMIGSFVYFKGEWHLNGVMIPLEGAAHGWEKTREKDPDYRREGVIDVTGTMLLEQTEGKEILYFSDTDALKTFLRKKMNFGDDGMTFIGEQDLKDKHPLLFIDKNAEKYGSHFSFAFTPCIADPDNPYYNKEIASKEAIEMLWNEQAITTETILYLLDHQFLPDMFDDPLLSLFSSHEEKENDIRFLLRYMRRENY